MRSGNVASVCDSLESEVQTTCSSDPMASDWRAAPGGRLPVGSVSATMLGAALICAVLTGSHRRWAFRTGLLIDSAYAQSKQQNPLEKARTAVETLINRLRGRDMPEGIVKSNGRIEATEVDVAAKYPGRLATLTVNEGDEVTAGQVVATISSPETEAQLRGAQAQVLKAKQALAEANATDRPAQERSGFCQTDYERAKTLVEHGNISQQVVDQRRNKLEAAEAGYVAANAQRDQAEAAIKAAEADVERLPVDSCRSGARLPKKRTRAIPARSRRRGGRRRTARSDHPRSQRRLHDDLSAGECRRAQLTLGDEARTILDPIPAICPPRDHQLCGDRGPVHAKERRDGRGAGETDVPGQAPGRSRGAQQIPSPGEDRGARAWVCPHRSEDLLARRTCGEASAMSEAIVARIERVTHRYGKTFALNDLTLDIPAQCMVGLIGPDGVGKSTLLALISGVRKIQTGKVTVLDGDMADERHRRASYGRIAYMPQGLGRNLYPTLSVFDNIDFFGRLFGQGAAERRERIDELLKATGLDPFPDRPCGKLSGGMKQKVSLCCSLMHDPDLLVLDEPTTGVDPLSRRQFWELIDSIRARRPQMSVIVATAYMDEAEPLRLARRNGRRQGHRAWRTEGDSRAREKKHARRCLHRPAAAGKARPASGGRRAAARRNR